MAQEAKHTPGPWAVNPVTAQVDAFDTGEPVSVCQLLWPTDLRSEAQTEANARLIAAAPDLLAALERCVSFCRGHRETPEKIERYEQVRAAIAKAKA